MKLRFLAIATVQLLFAIRLAGHDFPFALAEKVEKNKDNWIFSPYSITSCLAMAEMGAKGHTSEEMRRVLHLENAILPEQIRHFPASELDFTLHVAQGLWVNNDFTLLDSYTEAVKNSYQAIAERVDFNTETCEQINGWIRAHTGNKIQNLLTQKNLNPSTRLILANALYFRGNWQHPFSPHNTKPRLFYPKSGSEVEIPFMDQTNRFTYAENDKAQAISLPFHNLCETCEPICLIVMPRDKVTMTEELFESLYRNLSPKRVHLHLPKLTMEMELDLGNPLFALGMKTAFTNSADFSQIDGKGQLLLSQVLHKSFFALDEKGIEAAAATAAVMTTTAVRPIEEPPISFIADHPFYLFLLDKKSETLLFFGKFQNPKT